MDHIQVRLEALEQQTHTFARQLRWWQGLACGLIVLALLTWTLPLGTAQEDARPGGDRELAQRLVTLEDKLRHLSSASDEEGRPEVVITGANLRIVNGLGKTDCGEVVIEGMDPQGKPIPDCPNGLGNLIVGYNEPRPESITNSVNVRTGSHNVVVGMWHNFSSFGGLVVGIRNEISGLFAAVSGGIENTASGVYTSISGGGLNTASGIASSVSGGQQNTASGNASSVSGGESNTASAFAAAVSGGALNTASGVYAAVSGGANDTADGPFSAVSGGQNINIPEGTEFGWAAGSFDGEVTGSFRSP